MCNMSASASLIGCASATEPSFIDAEHDISARGEPHEQVQADGDSRNGKESR